MKYLLKASKYFAVLAGALILLNSCKKVKVPEPMGDAGTTIVKLINGDSPAAIVKKPIDFVPVPITLNLIDVRRDIPNSTELGRTMTITVKDDTAAVAAADPTYQRMPAAWYTISTPAVQPAAIGGNYVFTMKPGDFAQEVNITITDPTLLNPSGLYAFGFTITAADADGKISTQKSVIVEIGAKNMYDGKYDMWGRHNRTPYDFPYHVTMDMVTTGANSVIFYWPDVATFGHPIGTGPDPVGDVSWYGATVAPAVLFNPATNFVTSVYGTNAGGPPIDIYTGAGSGQGRFEPGTKKMYVYWRYNANDLRAFMDTLTYIGSR